MKIRNTLQVIKTNLLVINKYWKTPEGRYNMMVQVDYLTGLLAGVIMGMALTAGGWLWFIFVLALVAALTLGLLTVKFYTRMMRCIMAERK
jgi:hypothetical protein